MPTIADRSCRRDGRNLRAAYLQVLADAVTSVLAIVALWKGSSFGLVGMDPLMGIVGAHLKRIERHG